MKLVYIYIFTSKVHISTILVPYLYLFSVTYPKEKMTENKFSVHLRYASSTTPRVLASTQKHPVPIRLHF